MYYMKGNSMRGKIIVIEGTDCSGKETQSKKLIERLNNEGMKTEYFYFPNYDSPTGKIIGGPYLGKQSICEGWFEEGASNVDAKVASLYYAADRLYNLKKINNWLDEGINVVLDRYVYSNMAHQGGKIFGEKERNEMYEWIEELEFNLIKLPIPDIKIFLHVFSHVAENLKKNRTELDQHEKSKEYLNNAEKAYLEIVKKYDFKTIECSSNDEMRTIEDINEEVYSYVERLI